MCKYCEKVDFQNFAGKQFFITLDNPSGRGKGDICVAIDNCGNHTLHYESSSDIVDVIINFCPVCGRNLKENDYD